MSIPRALFVCFLAFLAAALSGAASFVTAQTKYGVTVREVKPAELAKARTYVWTLGRPSFNKEVDALIIAAVDRELAARGFAKLESGRGDVVVTYGALSRTDVDLEKTNRGVGPEVAVGTLIVNLTAPANKDLLFSARLDRPIDWTPATYKATVDTAVAALFEKYPTPTKR